MRITNGMMSKSFMRDLNRNLGRLNKINGQLTSGKEISRPSDNPFKVARTMSLGTDISTNKQYNENIKDTINWLETTDTALAQIQESTQRIRELMVATGNATYGSDEMNAIKNELNERTNEVAQLLNTTFDGKYLFGGTKTSTKPVATKDDINGNSQIYLHGKDGEYLSVNSSDIDILNQVDNINSNLYVEISEGVKMDYNVNAIDVLITKDPKGNEINFMDLMTEITGNLMNEGTFEDVVKKNLEQMDSVILNLNKLRSEVGAKQNRMESAEMQNEESNFNLTEILSKTQDIDFAEKSMEASTAQTIYVAALQTNARIIQPSLLDFLR